MMVRRVGGNGKCGDACYKVRGIFVEGSVAKLCQEWRVDSGKV